MNKVVETRASAEATPPGTTDARQPQNQHDLAPDAASERSNASNGPNGNGRDEQLEEITNQAHPFN